MSFERDRIDDLLDHALQGYSDVEPRAGFEARILARLRTAPKRPMWYTPAFAVPAVVILAVIVYGALRVESPDDSIIAPPPAIALRLPAPDLPTQSRSGVPAVKQTGALQRPINQQASLVRAKLPVERPLSQQEKLLLAFASENPQEILTTVEWQEHMRQAADEQTPPDQGER